MALQHGGEGTSLPSEHPQSPGAAPQAAAGGYTVGIRRTGVSVQITLTSADEYASMELYDSLVRSVENGCLRLELKLPRS